MRTMKSWAARLATLLLATAAPAHADQVRFTGQTTADGLLIRDALQNILRFAYATRQCTTLTAVEANVLDAYEPQDPMYRVGSGQITYESWSATLCGETIKFLISFWPSVEGGTMFGIGYPYPPDAP